jgi:uncharacterized PurR-regulated membrane protein YhhQ (DUF165 family)
MLMQNFRITIFGVVLLVAGSVAYMCFIEVLSLLVYSFSNGKPARRKAVKSVLYLFLAAMVFTALAVYLKNGSGKAAAFAAVSWLDERRGLCADQRQRTEGGPLRRAVPDFIFSVPVSV